MVQRLLPRIVSCAERVWTNESLRISSEQLVIIITFVQPQSGYQCPFPGCSKRYVRKFRFNEHQKIEHGIEDSHQCTRNFQCPFNCQDTEGEGALFKTNMELLNHCEKFHDDKLG